MQPTPDIKDKILDEAREVNYVTIHFLNELVPEDLEEEKIDEILDFLVENQIEIIAVPKDQEEEFRNQKIETLYEIDKESSVTKTSNIWLPGVEQEMIEHFKKHSEELYSLTPRKFEELVATIFKNQGFEVELTPPIKDGGFDVIAIQHDEFTGKKTYLIECKRFAPKNYVGVGIIRSLYGVLEHHKATKGIVATTSFFTRGAKQFCQENETRLALSDYNSITEWLHKINL